MDWIKTDGDGLSLLKKYRYVLIVVLAGILLMVFPGGKTEEEPEVPVQQYQNESLEEALSRILSMIQGAGKVTVLLTEAAGREILYQVDTDASSSGEKDIKTVLITDGSRTETGLVRRTDPPVYLGAIVVCQGADSPAVRLAVVEAVADATGLTTDQISVLKMKG